MDMKLVTPQSWRLFEAVELEHQTPEDAAAALGMSTAEAWERFSAIENYMQETEHEWIEHLAPRARALMICRVQDRKLQELYGEAMKAWHASCGPSTSTCERNGTSCTTTRPSFGQVRYLTAAARLAHLRIAAAEQMVKIHEKYPPPATDTMPTTPPVGPCAREEEEDDNDELADEQLAGLNTDNGETYDALPAAQPATDSAKIELVTPVRALLPPLNRKDRRTVERRRRRLNRASK